MGFFRFAFPAVLVCLPLLRCPADGSATYTDGTWFGKVCNVFRDDVDSECTFVTLATSNGTAYAYTRSDFELLLPYIGCRVRLFGSVMPMAEPNIRQHLRQALLFSSTNNITVLSQPDKRPFNAPPLTEAPPALSEIDVCGPRRATGVVLARWHGDTFILRTPSGDTIIVRLWGQTPPDCGAAVEAVGEVATDLYHYNLFQAQWRPAGEASGGNDEPLSLPLSEIFLKNDKRIISTRIHGRTIRVRGTLKSVLADENGFRRLLVGDGDHRIIADCSALPDAVAPLREGCELEVTGIGILARENWHPNLVFPRVTGVFLVPRTAADVQVLRQPSWWTPARLATALVLLLALLAVILVWNVSLRILVARKSHALLKEQSLKLTETLKVNERTRLAAELHDFHSQNLTALAYQISAAKNACTAPRSETARGLSVASRMLKSCRTELRRCLWDLRNDALDEPDFAAAIRKTVLPISGTARVRVRFAGRRAAISDSTAHGILSVLRELTANAVNHGRATDVRIAGEVRADGIRLSVRDNGCGFDPATRPGQDNGHFGLDGIKERLNRLGGRIDIESAPGKGTYVRLSVTSPQQAQS